MIISPFDPTESAVKIKKDIKTFIYDVKKEGRSNNYL